MQFPAFVPFALILCIAFLPGPVGADNYMGGNVVIGGSGPYSLTVTTTAQAAAPVPPAAVPATGSLSVTTTPAGAAIFIDGVQQGVSPATVPGLAPGSHTLLIRMNGYADQSAMVTITGGQMSTYTTDLSPAAPAQLSPHPVATKTPGFGAAALLGAAGAVILARKRRG